MYVQIYLQQQQIVAFCNTIKQFCVVEILYERKVSRKINSWNSSQIKSTRSHYSYTNNNAFTLTQYNSIAVDERVGKVIKTNQLFYAHSLGDHKTALSKLLVNAKDRFVCIGQLRQRFGIQAH